MQRRMDALISAMCGSLSEVLTHADSHSRALSDALSRRAIPLESATNAFLQGLDRRVEAAGADLEHLESLAFGTVSVEELLGHCCRRSTSSPATPTPSSSASSPTATSPRVPLVLLRSWGSSCCLAGAEVEDEVEEEGRDTGELEVPRNGGFGGSSSVLRSARKRFDDDDDDDALNDKSVKGECDKLPPYMKSLASWEELHDAVSKLNAYFAGDKAQGRLNQDDVGSIGLGRKGRSYLLILLRLNQLAMETIDGSIFYNLHKNDS
ncbi:hypothetical protein ZWY2020_030182 [Hordeum vulgare]|nr:hypothetical protein ZWY2020_030182 [Hordeum vulgare]